MFYISINDNSPNIIYKLCTIFFCRWQSGTFQTWI